MPDPHAANSLRDEVRSKTICGQCKSSTFLMWQLPSLERNAGAEDIVRGEERRGITSFMSDRVFDDRSEQRAGVIVRCAFFRMNVPNPFQVIDCEGFKQKKN